MSIDMADELRVKGNDLYKLGELEEGVIDRMLD